MRLTDVVYLAFHVVVVIICKFLAYTLLMACKNLMGLDLFLAIIR